MAASTGRLTLPHAAYKAACRCLFVCNDGNSQNAFTPAGSAGEGASNVIPERVRMTGTIRALTQTQFKWLRQRVTEVTHRFHSFVPRAKRQCTYIAPQVTLPKPDICQACYG